MASSLLPAPPTSWASESFPTNGMALPLTQVPTLIQSLEQHQLDPGSSSDVSQPSETIYSQLTSEISQSWHSTGSSKSGVTAGSVEAFNIDLRPQTRINGVRRCSLPPAQGGLFLLQEYLVDFNTAIPLFDAATISALFLDCYNGRADGQVISWVTLKVVLAIAHRLRAMSPLGVAQDTENVQTYLEESLAELPGLVLMEPSLLLAQCYLGVAIVLSTSSRPEPAATLVSMALRVLQDLHVNDPDPDPESVPPDQLQRERVFWIAYFMDADMSLRGWRLPSLSSNLTNVQPPAEDPLDGAGSIQATEGDLKVNIFRLRAELALLQAQLMEYVLAPRAAGHDDRPLHEIAMRLHNWRSHLLFLFEVKDYHEMLHRSDLVHVVILESVYFATVYAVHLHISHGYRLRRSPFSPTALIPAMAMEDAAMPHRDARRFLELLRLLPSNDVPLNWLSLEALVSGVVVTLTHVMHNAQDANAKAELDIARPVLHMLYQVIDFKRDQDLTRIQHLCADLYLRTDQIIRQGGAL
ncbi:hypothetical protein LTS15_009863 [Exophiala xenobiotica]|nr:hypothetical protein LTS15_009863 [Exophiala xenobiotica]